MCVPSLTACSGLFRQASGLENYILSLLAPCLQFSSKLVCNFLSYTCTIVLRSSVCLAEVAFMRCYTVCKRKPTCTLMKPYSILSYKISVYNRPAAQSPSFCIMKAALLFCLLAAGASIALARYKSSDFSEEGTGVFRYCMHILP